MNYKVKSHLELLNIKDDMYFVKDVDAERVYLLNEIAWLILSNINNKNEFDIKDLITKNVKSDSYDSESIDIDISTYINKLISMQLLEQIVPM